MRPASPLGRVRVRSYLRSVGLGLGAFSLLTLFRATLLLSTVPSTTDAPTPSPNPRFPRDLEGPVLDLGDDPPAAWASDLYITVKTTAKYHGTRLRDIVDTWFRLAPDKIWFFTDKDEPSLSESTGGHLVNTNCSAGHKRQALCCKMGMEYDFFLKSGKRWMCHFDDDNYVNVPELQRLLSQYDPREELYLGRPSTRDRIEIMDRDNMPNKVAFWFATGGAGFCLSRALALTMAPHASDGRFVELGERIRLPDDVTMGYLIDPTPIATGGAGFCLSRALALTMAPHASDGRFVELGERIRLPDDVTMGYLIDHLLGRELRVIDKFHSHLETMSLIGPEQLHSQVSLSAGSYSSMANVVSVPELFPADTDPSRFRSLHCALFPSSSLCPHSSPL